MIQNLFISDLHLDAARPRATAAFLEFLKDEARQAQRLYILGDLFEFWIGDDDDDPHSCRVLDALRAYTSAGHECLVMRGNRDFLLGHRFEDRCGAKLLPDTAIRDMFGQRVLMMHGDLLCTDDHAYQRHRRRVNDRRLQRLFLALPLRLRRAVAGAGRRASMSHTARLPAGIMDVNQAAVAAALTAHGARVLLHGHTHRPGVHDLEVGGQRCTRIVLGDWYAQGSVLAWSAAGFEFRTLAFG